MAPRIDGHQIELSQQNKQEYPPQGFKSGSQVLERSVDFIKDFGSPMHKKIQESAKFNLPNHQV